jgi:ATP-dependent protease ClpP protease subunit
MNRDKIRARLKTMAAVRNATAPSWYRIRNSAGTDGQPAEVFIYDEIGWIGHTAQDFLAELKSITAPAITLRINSPGGEIFDGIAIYNTLRSHPAHVTAHVDSLAASIASVIAQAADERVMQPFSQMMIHDGSGMCVGDAGDMREMADLLDRQSDNIAAIYAERCGGGQKSWRKKMEAESWYTAEEAVADGLADRVAKPIRQEQPPEEEAPRLAAKWDLSIFSYAGRENAPAPALGAAPALTDSGVMAAAQPLPDELDEVFTGNPADAPADDAHAAPTGQMRHCPECDLLVAETAMDDHRAQEHGRATNVLAVLAELEPPTGGLVKAALFAGAVDPFEFDAEDFRATLRTLVDDAPAAEQATDPVNQDGTMTCPECGTEMPEGTEECPNCGAEMETEGTEIEIEVTPGDMLAEMVATLAAAAPAPPAPEPEPEPEVDRSQWNAAPEPLPEPSLAETVAETLASVAAAAPAEVVEPAPEPERPAAHWREPEPAPAQTVPTNAWEDIGDVIAAAIRIQANKAPAPEGAPPEPAAEIEPRPDPVLLTRAIREEALR